MDDDYESVLFVCREVLLYQIGPRTGTGGIKASSWSEISEPLFKGRCRIIETGLSVPSKLSLRFEDSNTGELFAASPYAPTVSNPHGGVEACVDSSRYFVVTILDEASGSKAYLGLGFLERTDSFDFNVALQVSRNSRNSQ